jgi:hypothetical protein
VGVLLTGILAIDVYLVTHEQNDVDLIDVEVLDRLYKER